MKSFNPKKYGDFSRGEIIAVIQLSATLASLSEIQEKFKQLTGGEKTISQAKIIEVQADNHAFISKKREVYLNNIQGHPLNHPVVIYDMLFELYKECRKKVPSHTIKVADNVYETVEKDDLKTALAAIKIAKDFQMELKKLQLEELKRKTETPDTAPSEWELEDGLNLDE